MRNPTDKIVPADLIACTQALFRVLDGWQITYIEEDEFLHREGAFYINGQCRYDIGERTAEIFPCPEDADLRKYTLHEILHIAIAATDGSRQLDEMLVQDLTEQLTQGLTMYPVTFPEVTTIYAKNQPEYRQLPACVDGDRTTTCWHLSIVERLKLLFTGRLWLQQLNFGGPLQPQLPTVDTPYPAKSAVAVLTLAQAKRMQAKLEARWMAEKAQDTKAQDTKAQDTKAQDTK